MSSSPSPRPWAALASVFLVSFAALAFEISLTRVFSVLLNYHYVFVAVSGAVCGLGLGGFAWHLAHRRPGRRREAGWAAVGFALSMPGAIVALFAGSGAAAAHLWTAGVALLPFVFAGAFLAEAFRAWAAQGGRLYYADLLGAGLAAVLVVPLIGLTGALHLAFALGGLAGLGATAWGMARHHRDLAMSAALTACLLFAAWPTSARREALGLPQLPRAPEAATKAMLRRQAQPERPTALLDHVWSAYARTDLVRTDSPDAGLSTLQVYTDGDNPAEMVPFDGDLDSLSQRTRELPYLAFELAPRDTMLSIGPGAGVDFLWGLAAGFRKLDGVEINAAMAALAERYQLLNGDIYRRPGVRVAVEDGRSFISRSRQRWSLISSVLTQTATAHSGGHMLVESYIHTREAFVSYFDHLTPDGRYCLVTQSGPMLLRGALTALAAMEARGIAPEDGCRHLALLGAPEEGGPETPYEFLLIWKRSPITRADLARIHHWIGAGLARPLYLPDTGGHPALARIAAGKADLQEVADAGVEDEGTHWSIAPASDDRPFFLDLTRGVPRVIAWLLLGSLIAAVLYSLVLLARSRSAGRTPGVWLLYFGALGVGFMLIEVPLIQKFILFLGHPTASLAAILCCLLVGVALGSRLSQAWPIEALGSRIGVAAAAVALLGVVYALLLSLLVNALLVLPAAAKMAVMAALVVPLGLALGAPFPSGLRLLSVSHQDDVPWMWGVNGLLSVVGSAAAAAGAKFVGFSGCLVAAAAIYGAVALAAPRLRAAPAAPQPLSRRARRRGRR